MHDFSHRIETLLLPFATRFTPDGSQPLAVVHQWIHALARGQQLFGGNRGITAETLVGVLASHNLFKDIPSFKRLLLKACVIQPPKHSKFTFIDLFAGIGGMRIGFQNAGGTCVFSSEFEKNAQITYLANHGDFPFGDITKIPIDDIPDHDVLVGGFPCQPFSHAGLKRGIEDTRGTLFHNIAEILEKKRPRIALLENVKGLISNDKGHTLQVILKTLLDIGYRCNIDPNLILHGSLKQIQQEAKKMVLRSIDFGVPQNRQRIYLVLWREVGINNFLYPSPTCTKTRVGDILEPEPDIKFTISDKLWNGHQRRKQENLKNGKGFGFGLVDAETTYTNTISARYYKDGSEILIRQEGRNPRKITQREAARLQGFPDNFQLNKSAVQAYKQFGNSVSVPVVSEIAESISKILER